MRRTIGNPYPEDSMSRANPTSFDSSRRAFRALFVAAIASLGISLGGCMIGNSSSNDCTSADPNSSSCMCSGIGNCDRACVGGNCTFRCEGTTNCNFACEGGGCDLTCANTGNCILDCPGCGCTLHCNNTGNCIQMGCNDAGTD